MLKNRLVKDKVHMKDIKEGTHPREMPVLIVGKEKFWASACTKDMIASHDDCLDCKKEFEKPYSSSRRCFECEYKFRLAKYMKKPFKEWNGQGFVYSEIVEQYFNGSDEIDDYINDLDKDDIPGSLRLVICKPNTAGTIDGDWWSDSLPEDGEMPEEMVKAIDEFNKKLIAIGTLSWSPGEYRTDYDYKRD